jgi:hypothetical protein
MNDEHCKEFEVSHPCLEIIILFFVSARVRVTSAISSKWLSRREAILQCSKLYLLENPDSCPVLPTCSKPVIRFRNYKPSDQSLVEKGVAQVLPQPALPSAAIKEQEQADIAKLLAAPVSFSPCPFTTPVFRFTRVCSFLLV